MTETKQLRNATDIKLIGGIQAIKQHLNDGFEIIGSPMMYSADVFCLVASYASISTPVEKVEPVVVKKVKRA